MAEIIAIKGLSQVSRALRRIDSEAPKQLRIVFNEAAQLVVDYARTHIEHRTGRAANTIRARSTRTAARIAMGGPKAPYVPWLDFGGTVGPKKTVKRPFLKEGRYVYVGLAKKRPMILELMQEGVIRIAQDAGLEVD